MPGKNLGVWGRAPVSAMSRSLPRAAEDPEPPTTHSPTNASPQEDRFPRPSIVRLVTPGADWWSTRRETRFTVSVVSRGRSSELAAGSSSDSIALALIARYPETDVDEIRSDVDRTLDALVAKGLLIPPASKESSAPDHADTEPA